MWKKYLISFSVTVFLAAAGSFVLGQPADIQYPVAELGNCQNESSCRDYCDEPENLSACLDFARENSLMSEEELDMAEKFEDAGGTGPGGCTSQDSCETYCNDIGHINECIAFAEENNLMSPEELEEAKKVQEAINRGVQPPPCGNKKACDVYCEEPGHMEECITFAAEAGFMEGQELEDAQKMLAAVKRGVTPPPCRGKEACDKYCSQPDNMEVCMNFALEAGFMSEEEKEGAQKMLQAIKRGVKPLPCQGREECDQYCGQDENLEECMNFAVEAGFMSEEDASIARKTGGKGPGNCRGKEECEDFCNNPDNQETCFNFAKENGLMSEDDLRQMDEGKQQIQEALNQMPPEVLECLNTRLGAETVEKLKTGQAMPSRDIGDSMQACFQEMGAGPQMGPSNDTMMQGGGPGGCQTPEDCENFMPPQEWPEGQEKGDEIMPPKQTGPGGCQSEEECQSYCENNPEACGAPGGPSSEEGIEPEQFQEQFQQQYQQQMQQQMPPEGMMPQGGEQFTPPPATEQPPQSFLEKAKNWLAGAGLLIKR